LETKLPLRFAQAESEAEERKKERKKERKTEVYFF
jgi:hypothetical protein